MPGTLTCYWCCWLEPVIYCLCFTKLDVQPHYSHVCKSHFLYKVPHVQWCIMYCVPVAFKLSRPQTAWSLGVGKWWKNCTLSHCCKMHWNVAGIWLQWWSVALVTGRGFRWRLMQSWWQKAKRQPVYGEQWGDIAGVWGRGVAWVAKCGKEKSVTINYCYVSKITQLT